MNEQAKLNAASNQKHIGILTFHYVLNPGSALQAYGLCRSINELSSTCNCEVINYQKKNYIWNRSYAPGSRILIATMYYIHLSISLLIFRRFEKRFIKSSSKRIIKRSDLKKLEKEYDYFIVGSDQIWNTQSLKHVVDDTYFLDFCNDSCKKISYAASIGLPDIPIEDKPKVAKYLNDFSFLSVREPLAQDIIEKLIGRRPQLVVDPTLLITKEKWEQLAIYPKIKEDYSLAELK